MANFHSPKSYAAVAAVLETGHYFDTTPHGLRGHAFRAPVCGTDDSQAEIMFHGWRDDFSAGVVDRIRATQARRRRLYLTEPGRPGHDLADIAYAVAYKGQCIAYVTVDRAIFINEPVRTAGAPARRALGVVETALRSLAERPDHYLFSTDPD